MDTATSDLILFFVAREKKIDARFTTDYGEMHLSISPGKNKTSVMIQTYKSGKHWKQAWGYVLNDLSEFRLGTNPVPGEEVHREFDQLKAL